MSMYGQRYHWKTYINLLIGPAVHAQRFDFGNVGTELAVERGASHA